MQELEKLRNHSNKILNPGVKDSKGLNDFQKLPDKNARMIPRVGIERFRTPITVERRDKTTMSHDAEASMFVLLENGKTGVNMSRFPAIMQEEIASNNINNQFFKHIVGRYRKDLRDYENEKLIPRSEFSLKFSYPVKQPSLKSGNWGWQYYALTWGAVEDALGTRVKLTLEFEYSSTCPCSLSMSKQYEEDYRSGATTEGSGIATAHGQRSTATCSVEYDIDSDFHIEDLVDLLRLALPTETQSLVKRVDEQAFAILNGEHPMFVEHVSRRLAIVLDDEKRISDWHVKIEHFESLHSHNAVAYIQKERKPEASVYH